MKFFKSVAFTFILLLLIAPRADAVKFASVNIGNEGLALSYISPDASGDFQLTAEASLDVEPLGRAYFFSFMHKGQSRLLLAEVDGQAGAGTSQAKIYVYDPSDLETPLASGDLVKDGTNYPLKVQQVAEFGDHILLAGECTTGVILEVNPENCSVVNVHSFSEGTNDGSLVAVNDGKVYANYANTTQIVEMTTFGTVARSLDISDISDNYIGARCVLAINNAVYFSASGGLYELDTSGTDLSVDVIVAGNISDFCGDGSDGFYFVIDDSTSGVQGVYHWDGTTSDEVYSYTLAGAMDYDADSQTLAFMKNEDSLSYVQILLLDGAELPIKVESLDEYFFSADGSTAKILTASEEKPEPPEPATTAANPVSVEDLSETTINNIISNISGINSSADIKSLTADNIKEAKTPSTGVTNEVSGDGFVILQSSSTLSVTEPGYYLVSLDVAPSLRGTEASKFKIYLVNSSVYTSAFAFNAAALPSGITTATALNTDGTTFTTVPAQILVASNLTSAGDYSMYLAKASEASSSSDPSSDPSDSTSIGGSGSGCNSGFAALSAILLLAVFKKNK